MSEEDNLLAKISSYDAFVHTEIPPGELKYLFKPFQEISNAKVESRIKDHILKNHIIAIESDTGTGKTSVAHYSILLLGYKYFPIVLSPTIENTEIVCSNVEEFTKYVLTVTLSNVKRLGGIDETLRKETMRALSGEISYTEGKKNGFFGKLKTAFMLPLVAHVSGEAGGNIERFSEEALNQKIYNSQRIDALRDLCDTISKNNLNPVFYLDDTDKFLKREDFDRSELIPSFFGKILPALAKIGAPVVVSAHTYYENSPTFREAKENVFNDVIMIPTLDFKGVKEVIQKRISAVSDASIDDVFDNSALKKLYGLYESNPKIRSLILRCKECVEKALADGLKNVNEDAVVSIGMS